LVQVPASTVAAAAPSRPVAMALVRRAIAVLLLGLCCGCIAAATCTPPGSEQTCAGKDALAAFREWFVERGGQAPGVAVQDFDEYGRGLIAERTIREGQVIVKVPLRTVISQASMLHFSAGAKALVEAFPDPAKSTELLAAFLLLEKRKGASSKWKPYLDVLPQEVPAAWTFSAEALAGLHGYVSVAEIDGARKELEDGHPHMSAAVKQALAQDGVAEQAEVTLPELQWAVTIVDSRALNVAGGKYLVPMADMFNYKAHPRPRRQSNGDFFLQHHQVNSDAFVVRADRNFEAKEQVFMDYGDNPSYIYLRYHGFVPSENPFDCVHLDYKVSDDGQDSGKVTDLSRVRKLLGLPESAIDCIRWNKADATWQRSPIAALARLAKMTKQQLEHCESLLAQSSGRDQRAVQECLSQVPANRASLLQVLHKAKEERAQVKLQLSDKPDGAIALAFRAAQDKLMESTISFIETGKPPPSASGVPSVAQAVEVIVKLGLPARELWDWHARLTTAEKVDQLNEWVAASEFPVAAIQAAAIPGLRVGTLATKPLGAEEPYLVVPSHAVMDTTTATESLVYPIIYHISENLGRPDDFHELLLFFLFEYFVQGPRSKWWPYLALLPRPEELYAPAYYTDADLSVLKGHKVHDEIVANNRRVRERFSAVRRFFFSVAGEQAIPPEVFTEENYYWAHAILDSRGIWWGGQRHLVPLLDMVNCRAGGKRPHRTEFDPDLGGAVTRTAEPYKAGDQVFEDYGQPNHVYFLFHGFSLAGNEHDCIRVSLNLKQAQREKLAVRRFGSSAYASRVSQQEEFCVRAPLDRSNNVDLANILEGDFQPVRAAVRTQLEAMGGSAEDDLARIAAAASENQKNALAFLANEKRLMRDLVAE